MIPEQHTDPFRGNGEIARLCRAIDWSATPLGDVAQWPRALRDVVRTCLESPFPINLWCGPELVLIYNDAYRPVLGSKHPESLGRRGQEVWAEIWDAVGPMTEQIHAGGPPIYADDAPFVIHRAGADEAHAGDPAQPNAWFTFSLSPVRAADGSIVALLNVVSETTSRVLAERDLRESRAKAERAESRLTEVFTQSPAFLAVVRGPQHVFEFVNSSYNRLTGHRELVDLPMLEALPELRGQGFDELLDEVLKTGEPFVGREVPVTIRRTREGEPEQRFVDFVYYPITEADGTRTGVVAHGSDVTDHVLSRREAQRARQEAEEASRAKSQFLANMSHEIRTPINAIVGYTDLLELGISGPLNDDQRDQLERVRLSSRHLLTIVEDILDVAKVEAGRLHVEHDRVQVGSTAGAAVALVAPQAADRDIDIIDESDDTTTYVGDEDRVRQILVNLLSNAVKFTAPGGTVHLTCGTDRTGESPRHIDHGASMVYVRVADTGIGIPEQEAHKVFRPFSQVESGRTRTRGGTGLGLTISRHLARLMGGDITFESEVGRGSTFTVWLPSDTTTLDSEIVDDTRASQPSNLAATGNALRGRLPEIMSRYRERLRRDPLISVAPDLGDADLEDHASTFLTDIAQSLVVLETSRVVPERLLQDGSEIQRVVAELHGRQRAQLGWAAEALRHEWAILWEEIESAVHSEIRSSAELAGALDLLKRFLDRAERISLRSRAATMQAISDEPPADPAGSTTDLARQQARNGDKD